MQTTTTLQREARYGIPAADQILVNRDYTVGYSYYFRQAKWALEIIDPGTKDIARKDNFRSDYRIPSIFRADKADYVNSGYDRGHLVSSANHNEQDLQNSETFLLSNMSPQAPELNRRKWADLEQAIRDLDAQPSIYETYVLSGPVFYFDQPVQSIGSKDRNGVTIPIPNAYFKCVLTENNRGYLHMWSFMMENGAATKPLEDYRVSTDKVEQYTGIKIWEKLVGRKMELERGRVRKMWKY